MSAQPYRAPWIWRYKIRLTVALIALVRLVWWQWPHVFHENVAGDYRDPGVLARAIQAAEESKTGTTVTASSCGHLTGTSYLCTLFFPGGSDAVYDVTVAADGTWWHTA